jgi:hypothetical protein
MNGCLGLLGPWSCGPTSEDVVAILIQHQHQIRPTELASLAQFDGKDLGLTYRKFRTRTNVFTAEVIPFRALR